MRLIHNDTKLDVKIGDKVIDFRGEPTTVKHFDKPTSPASEGKISVQNDEGYDSYLYVSVFNLSWIEREDREPEEEKTYKVIRKFQNSNIRQTILKTGLTLKEAQAHCNSDEASSDTCSEDKRYNLRTKGAWFECYTEE